MQLSAARDWEPSTTIGARFIVPLGILHLSRLAANLAVYATPTSDWHASLCACMLLSIIPDSDSTRRCYRVIFWKFLCGCIARNEICSQDLRWYSRGMSWRLQLSMVSYSPFNSIFDDQIGFLKEKRQVKI